MIIRQFQFPHEYTDDDKFESADHDRLLSNDYTRITECLRRHTGTGDCGLASWVEQSTDAEVMNCFIDLFNADRSVKWTGYRIMGSVNRSNGFPVWSLTLYAKHPNNKLPVYSDKYDAPNIHDY